MPVCHDDVGQYSSRRGVLQNQNVQVEDNEVLCYFSEKFRIDQISLILFCIEEPIQLIN